MTALQEYEADPARLGGKIVCDRSRKMYASFHFGIFRDSGVVCISALTGM